VAGSVLREVWTNIGNGLSTDDIPLETTPQASGFQTDLDARQSYGDDYGVRLRGYITAPATGNYTFWIASDDNSDPVRVSRESCGERTGRRGIL